jgi:arabinose-5-phosphate isomerase
VRDIMQHGEALPLAPLGASMSDAIMLISEKRLGCVGIVGADGRLAGVITDGDLRRRIGQTDLLTMKVDDVMTRTPRTAPPDTLVGAALDLLNQTKITVLFIVEHDRPVGIVHMHDLLRIGVA